MFFIFVCFYFFLGTISSALISQARLPKGQTGVSDLSFEDLGFPWFSALAQIGKNMEKHIRPTSPMLPFPTVPVDDKAQVC